MHATAPSDHPESPRDPVPRGRYRRLIKAVRWFYAISTAFFLLPIIVVAILLHSTAFHDYVLRTAQKQAEETLGVRVQIQNYALDLSNLRLDIYGVTVDGASPYASPPLLQVRHALASIRIVSILQRKWYLDDIRIDQPVVQLFVDKNGHSNIPTIKSSGSNSNTSIFDLGIRRAVLDHGEIYYNNQPTPLTADLHDVDFHSVFIEATRQYSGKLTYTNGRIVYGTFQPFTHDLEAQFDATPDILIWVLRLLCDAPEASLRRVPAQGWEPRTYVHLVILNEVFVLVPTPWAGRILGLRKRGSGGHSAQVPPRSSGLSDPAKRTRLCLKT